MSQHGCKLPAAATVTEFQIPELTFSLVRDIAPIASISLFEGWAQKESTNFKSAVLHVIDKNPILSGAFKKRSEHDLVVEPYKNMDLIVEIDGPTNFHIPRGIENKIKIIHDTLEPLFAVHSLDPSQKAIDEGTPLFRVILMNLPGNCMACCVGVNHLIADGWTYFKLLRQIDLSCKGESLEELEWYPSRGDEYFWPSTYNEADKATYMNMGHHVGLAEDREAAVKIVNTDAFATLKQEGMQAAQGMGISFLSTNDIFVAALCEAVTNVPSAELVLMSTNMRGRDPYCTDSSAGNYWRPTLFPAQKGRNPAFIRSDIIKNLAYYSLEGNGRISESPVKESVEKGQIFAISNLLSPHEFFEPPETSVVCQVLLMADVKRIACDMTFICPVDKNGTVAVYDNYSAGKRGDEMFEHLALCKSYNRLFNLTPPSPAVVSRY